MEAKAEDAGAPSDMRKKILDNQWVNGEHETLKELLKTIFLCILSINTLDVLNKYTLYKILKRKQRVQNNQVGWLE